MLPSILTLISMVLALGLAPFCGFTALVAFAAAFARRTPHPPPKAARAWRFTILIPANNDGEALQTTLRAVQEINTPADQVRIVVVANSAHENALNTVRSAGATVWESGEAGDKWAAVKFGLDNIMQESRVTDAVVLLDPKTRVDPELLRHFSWQLDAGVSWIQAHDAQHPSNATWFKGLDALGISVLWQGNGMCCAYEALARQPWSPQGAASAEEFGWRLRLVKERVHFCDGARVYADGTDTVRSAALVRGQLARRIIRARGLSMTRKLFYLIELYMPPLKFLTAGLVMACLAYAGAATGEFGALQRTTLSDLLLLEAGALVFYAASSRLTLSAWKWRFPRRES